MAPEYFPCSRIFPCPPAPKILCRASDGSEVYFRVPLSQNIPRNIYVSACHLIYSCRPIPEYFRVSLSPNILVSPYPRIFPCQPVTEYTRVALSPNISVSACQRIYSYRPITEYFLVSLSANILYPETPCLWISSCPPVPDYYA